MSDKNVALEKAAGRCTVLTAPSRTAGMCLADGLVIIGLSLHSPVLEK